MKKTAIAVALLIFGFAPMAAFAQSMMQNAPQNMMNVDATADSYARGKAILEQLQSKSTACEKLASNDFEALGEYFMEQMMGSSHKPMDAMMNQMMGENAEKQMHETMGARLSGCSPNSAYPASGTGFLPMMQMMMGGGAMGGGMMSGGMAGSNMMGGRGMMGGGPASNNMRGNAPWVNNYMMGLSGPAMWFGWIFMVIWWVLVIAAIVALIKWLLASKGKRGESPVDILKERYAKGEITKEEFELRKKDIGTR